MQCIEARPVRFLVNGRRSGQGRHSSSGVSGSANVSAGQEMH